MFKKVLFGLMILSAGIAATLSCSSKVSALNVDSNSEIYNKIIRSDILSCYLSGPNLAKVLPNQWPNEEFYGLFDSIGPVKMPTGYTSLEDNSVSCKGFIYGTDISTSDSGEYDGLLNITNKNITPTSDLEAKKRLAEGLGYEENPESAPGNPNALTYFTIRYTYTTKTETGPHGCGFLWLSPCEDEDGPYNAAAYVTGTKVNNDGTVAQGMEIFSSGNGINLTEAGINYEENDSKTGGVLSVKCEDFKQGVVEFLAQAMVDVSSYDYEENFNCINGDISVIYNQTKWNDSNNSIVGFLKSHLPDEFSLHYDRYYNGGSINYSYTKLEKKFESNGTISNEPISEATGNITLLGQYDRIEDVNRITNGMNYFTGGTDLFFSDPEIYVFYIGYLVDYYKADFQCDASKKYLYADREGYVKASNILYNNTMQEECYVKATMNADKKVNGVNNMVDNGNNDGSNSVFEEFFGNFGDGKMAFVPGSGGEKTFEEVLAQIADLNVTPESIAEANIAATGEDNESGSSESDPCYNAGVEGMSWILCPVINNSSRSVSVVEGLIRDWLQINPENTIEKGQAYKAWEIFRNFANAFLIIIFLIIIFSQLTGYGIDNYGIKKMLPRLIVMGILINLSYILCELAIDLSNILGVGLDNLFKSIGEGINPTGANLTGQAIVAVVLGLITAGGTIAGIAILSGGGVMIIVSLVLALLVALISVLMFFVMLGARMIIVILFTILSPVAFALYILPNTQSIFKKWWKVFEAALIVYPICGALYGMSTIIKAIVIDSNGNAEFIPGIIAVVAPFLPFLTLPTLLKSAMAGLGALGGTLTMLGNGLRKGAQSGSGAIQSGIKGSERYKNSMQDRARNRQIKMMDRGIDRLQNKRRPLTGNEELRLARMQQTQDKLRNEDRAARAIVEQNRTKDMDLSGLSKEWNDAWEAGNKEKLDAMTSVINSRYGAAGANEIAKRIATKNIANDENSQSMMKVLQNNMNHDSTLANNMRNKASDAYGMISDGGKDRNGNYQNLSHFTDNNEIAKSDKDWSTQSSATLQRAIDSGRLTKEQIKRILNSSDTSIQSGLDDDKRKVLRDAVPEFTTPVQSTPITSGNAMTDEVELNALLRQQRQNNGSGNDKRSPGGVILP